MAEATIQDYGFGTLEESAATSRPVADYWCDFSEAYHELGDQRPTAQSQRPFLHASNFMRDVASIAIWGERPLASLEPVPDWVMMTRDVSYARMLAAYDRLLGSMNNRLLGSQEDMLRGASLALTASDVLVSRSLQPVSLRQAVASPPAVSSTRCGSTFTAAHLVHKAAWLEQDNPGRQINLFSIAAELYDRTANKEPRVLSERSVNYALDCRLHIAYAQYRLARERGEGAKQSAAINEMGRLVTAEAADAWEFYQRQLGRKRKYHNSGDHGILFEHIVPLVIHSGMLDELARERPKPHETTFEARRAFRHEDDSPMHDMRPRSSFDMVVQNISSAGILTVPVQLKHRRAHHSGERQLLRGEGGYMPGIVTLRAKNIGVVDMYKVAQEIFYRYKNKDVGQHRLRRPSDNLVGLRRLVLSEFGLERAA